MATAAIALASGFGWAFGLAVASALASGLTFSCKYAHELPCTQPEGIWKNAQGVFALSSLLKPLPLPFPFSPLPLSPYSWAMKDQLEPPVSP